MVLQMLYNLIWVVVTQMYNVRKNSLSCALTPSVLYAIYCMYVCLNENKLPGRHKELWIDPGCPLQKRHLPRCTVIHVHTDLRHRRCISVQRIIYCTGGGQGGLSSCWHQESKSLHVFSSSLLLSFLTYVIPGPVARDGAVC